jgi:hypothetical protein
MNDPWNTLVDGLAGRPCPTPSSWAKRRIHRMCDDQPTVLAPAAQRRPATAQHPLRPGFGPAQATPHDHNG